MALSRAERGYRAFRCKTQNATHAPQKKATPRQLYSALFSSRLWHTPHTTSTTLHTPRVPPPPFFRSTRVTFFSTTSLALLRSHLAIITHTAIDALVRLKQHINQTCVCHKRKAPSSTQHNARLPPSPCNTLNHLSSHASCLVSFATSQLPTGCHVPHRRRSSRGMRTETAVPCPNVKSCRA